MDREIVATSAKLTTRSMAPALSSLVLRARHQLEVVQRSAVSAPAQVIDLEARRDGTVLVHPRRDVSPRLAMERVALAIAAPGRELAAEDGVSLDAHIVLGIPYGE